MLYADARGLARRAPPAGRALRHVGPRQDPHRGHAARGGRLVPLLGRFPHRHPLHGRAHRRQLQARGDAQPVPAPAAALGFDLHRLEHHLPEPRRRSRPTSASPATRPRAASRSTNTSAASASTATPRSPPPATRVTFIEQGRGHLRLRPLRLRHLRLALRGRRPARPRRPGADRPRRAPCCRSGSAAPRSTSTSSPRRFDRAPKPMYYPEAFLTELWNDYLRRRGRGARRPSTPTPSSATASAR